MSKNYVLVVEGKDSSGIIAKVTGVLSKNACNLEDVSMTLLEGEFAMMLVLSMRPAGFEKVKRALEKVAKPCGLSLFWRPLSRKLVRGERHSKNTDSWIVSAMGRDQVGIVHQVSQVLAAYKLNITDLNSRILGQGKKSIYTMVLEVDIPRKFKTLKLEQRFSALSKKLKIEIQMRRVELLEM